MLVISLGDREKIPTAFVAVKTKLGSVGDVLCGMMYAGSSPVVLWARLV